MAGGETITLAQATSFCENFRDNAPKGATKAYYFSKTNVQSILDQTDCDGIRIYNAIDENGNHTLVIVGTDDDSDMTDGLLLDRAGTCPPNCDDDSPLNGD